MTGGTRAIKYVIAVTILGVMGFVACQGYVFIEEPKHQTGTQRNFIPIETISKADILFLVDNSGSMAQEQENLAVNFADFIKEVLKGQNDFHIGIITTDVNLNPLTECGGACNNGMDCIAAQKPSGAVNPGKSYCTKECLADADCQNYYCASTGDCTPSVCTPIVGFTNGKKYCHPSINGRLRWNSCKDGFSGNPDAGCDYTDTADHPHEKVLTNKLRTELGDADFQAMFRDNVRVGTGGSGATGFEKGLMALRNALDPEYVDPVTGLNLVENENAGFLRPEARLTLIVVSDEEDCSHDLLDPNFDERKNTNEVCYPSPNTCHPDCQPREASNGCYTTTVPPEQEVPAVEDSEYVRKGDTYCMIECSQDAECESSPVPGQKCGLVAGFGTSQKYCNCRFDAPTTNTNSKYAYLTPAQDFIDFFKGLKKDPDDVNMAVIIGAAQSGANAGEPENCSSPNGVACAGKRYHEVARGMTKYLSDSICKASFKQTLIDIAGRLIVSNERVLTDEPVDPSCIQVSVGGSEVEHCKTLTSCGAQPRDGGTGDAGTDDTTCPEAARFCENNAKCEDNDGQECDCAAISDPDRGCHCAGGSKKCARPIYWQYKPPEDCRSGGCCKGNDSPKIVFHGCGLEAGDKLEINFLAGGTTSGDAGVTCE